MLGFELDAWDYATFAVIFVAGMGGLVAAIFVASLPGQIAIARKHPDAEAVKIMGYAGFLPVVPWIQAFIWAFKPTDIIDVRRFPRAEAVAIDQEIARLEEVDLPIREGAAVVPPPGDGASTVPVSTGSAKPPAQGDPTPGEPG